MHFMHLTHCSLWVSIRYKTCILHLHCRYRDPNHYQKVNHLQSLTDLHYLNKLLFFKFCATHFLLLLLVNSALVFVFWSLKGVMVITYHTTRALSTFSSLWQIVRFLLIKVLDWCVLLLKYFSLASWWLLYLCLALDHFVLEVFSRYYFDSVQNWVDVMWCLFTGP